MKYKCPKCGKEQKENTAGNMKYCQGHSAFDFAPEDPGKCVVCLLPKKMIVTAGKVACGNRRCANFKK